MLLRQIVEINSKGSLRSSVNFDQMADKDDNLALCEEFIFNYDKDKPTESTVGVLDALRSSYDGRGYANIHLVIQMYGKGKSHFAVAIANYFKQSADSKEVRAILTQIDNAAGSSSPVSERLRAFKNRGNHFVICLSGDRGGDLKKQFLKTVIHNLKQEEGITGTIAQRLCADPLKYLEAITESEQAIAEDYLEANCNISLSQLIRALQDNKYDYVEIVRDLSRQINRGGIASDFETDLDVQAVLKDLIETLCTGENRRFLGVLILFDELNYYLQSWSSASTEAGGTILQNITNICESNSYKGKIALMSFAQSPPVKTHIAASEEDNYFKLASRLAPPDTTYYPASSLELVLDNLIIQHKDTPEWKSFEKRFENQLLTETRIAYEQRIRTYREKGFDRNWFHKHITLGCFPLHPLTAYLLCTLDFVQIQDRTAIAFLRGRVKSFIASESVERDNTEQLNCIYPVDLINEFVANFSNHSAYAKYKEAEELVIGSEDPDELTVLKGLLLYYVNKDRLIKPDTEEHREILANLTGLSKPRVDAALKKLVQVRDVIYYNAQEKSYRFHVGLSPSQVEQELEQRIKPKLGQVSTNDVVNYCLHKIGSQPRIAQYLGCSVLAAKHFIDEYKLIAEEWRFELKIYTIDGLTSELSKPQPTTKERGILAYVIAKTPQELQSLRHQIDQLLAQSQISEQIAVAIPTEETGNLAEILLKIRELRTLPAEERGSLGAASDSLLEQYEKEVDTRLTRILNACTLYSIKSNQIPQSDRNTPQRVISELLKGLYHSVPPAGSIGMIPQMKSGHPTGSTVIGYVAKHLLTNTLNPQFFPKQEYKTVVNQIFVDSWHLLIPTSQKYSVQEPTHKNILAAWNVISQMTELGERKEQTVRLEEIWKALSADPYGYSEYPFIILLSGWLAYHSKEVVLRGKLPGSKTTSLVTKSLKDWAEIGFLEKARYFVSDWIIKGGATLIRRQQSLPKLPSSPIDYEQGSEYVQAVSAYLETAPELEPSELTDLNRCRDQVKAGVKQIDAWLKPIAQLEKLISTDALESLLQGYPSLLQQLETPTGEIVIFPTQEQRDRQNQTRQAVAERIEQLIPEHCDRIKSLTTEQACIEYEQQTQQMLEQLKADIFPAHWQELLQSSLQSISLRTEALKKQAAITERLTLIQTAKNRLTSNSNQQDYASVRHEIEQKISEIEALVSEVSAIDPTLTPSDEKATYQPLLEIIVEGQSAFMQQLETFQQQLAILQTVKETQQFQATLVGKSFQYRGSPDEERYNAIHGEASLLLRLFELAEIGRTETIAECETEVARLNEWKSDKEQELTPLIQARLDALLGDLAHKKAQIQERQRKEAQAWLENLEQEYIKLSQETDSNKQGEISRRLLSEIRSQAGQKSQILSNKQSLKKIFDHCVALQSNNTENQVIALFDQLSRHRRGKLLVTLSKRLDTPTEEAHDG